MSISTEPSKDHVPPPPAPPARDTESEDVFADAPDDQIVPPHASRKFSWKMPLALLILAALAFFGYRQYQAAKKAAAAQTQYKIATVTTGEVKKTVTATGVLKPWSAVDIKSKAGGRINQILVNEGDMVKKGQILARIDPSDTVLAYQQAEAEVNTANASVKSSDYDYQLQLQQSALGIATARDQLNNALAAKRSAAAALATARVNASAQPGLTASTIKQAQEAYNGAVRDRQQLNSSQPQDTAAAQAAYDQAVADKNVAVSNETRQKSLLEKGFVSQQTVDQSVQQAISATATLNSAREHLNRLKEQQQSVRDSADARVAQARAALQNARQQTDVLSKQNALRQAQAAYAQAAAQASAAQTALQQAIANQTNNQIKQQAIDTAKASVERANADLVNAKTTLDQTVVRAPEDGIILTKYLEQGTIITSGLSMNSTGTSIVQIGEVARMYVDAAVDETDFANVDNGQKVDVTFDAYPGVPFEGVVARLEPQAEVDNNVTTIHVRVEVDNSSPAFRLLKPGMNATCEFVVGKKADVLEVPNEAIQEDDNGSYVLVASGGKPAPAEEGSKPDSSLLVGVKTRRVAVTTGLAGNDSTEITSGLKAGDTIVTQTIEPDTTTKTSTAAGGSPFGGGMPRMGGGGGSRGGR